LISQLLRAVVAVALTRVAAAVRVAFDIFLEL
jgi:hypothetical protein